MAKNSPGTVELVERIIGDLQGRNSGSLIIANVPGLRTSSNIALGDRAVLLRAPGDEYERQERSLLFSLHAFRQVGVSGLGMVVTRGRTEANATLVVWATEGPNLEPDLLRLPLAAINLILDSPRPILVSESVLGQQDVTPGQGAHQFLHDLPADDLPDIVPAESRGDPTGSSTLTDEARRMLQSLLSVVKSDNAIDTAIHMLTSGDSK